MESNIIEIDEIIYQKEINIGFFNFDDDKFNEMIKILSQSPFSKYFSLKNNILYFKEFIKASFEEKQELKNEIIDEDEIEKEENNLTININNCKFVKKREEDYDFLIKEKIDFYFIFNNEIINENFLEEIQEYSKQNYIIFNMGKDLNEDIIKSNKYLSNQYDYFEINNFNLKKYDEGTNILIFNDFLLDLKQKFDLYTIFQKYSIEKSIISFKDYLYNFNKYNKIKEENQIVELFNKFEKLSFNNDHADIAIILIQLMTLNKNILNSNFIFNVKTLKCGFCTNKINECEFDEDTKCFLCYRCKYTKNNYPKNLK